MTHTDRLQKVLALAQKISESEKLPFIGNYSVIKAMLEGSQPNIVHLVFMKMGIDRDRFMQEIEILHETMLKSDKAYATLGSKGYPSINTELKDES